MKLTYVLIQEVKPHISMVIYREQSVGMAMMKDLEDFRKIKS